MKIALRTLCFLIAVVLLASLTASSQQPREAGRQNVRTVSIPISIYTKTEMKSGRPEELIEADRLTVKENKEEQTILSIRSVADTPLTLAILVQDDLSSGFNLQLRDLKNFIRNLPRGSRVMVAYVRGGSLQIRQRFTNDLSRAADTLRIVTSNSAVSPRSPYDGVIEALNRFDALPAGRRAVLLISDGLDTSGGDISFSGQSIDLDRAILRAQRRSVAVFSIYSPTVETESAGTRAILAGQSSLQKLSDETGGRAFFQGSIAPISFVPFFRELSILLTRQFLLSYLSTHMKRGYHKVEVLSTNPEIKIEHPKGYYYR